MKKTENTGRKGSKGKFALKDLDVDKAKGGLEKDESPRGGTGGDQAPVPTDSFTLNRRPTGPSGPKIGGSK